MALNKNIFTFLHLVASDMPRQLKAHAFIILVSLSFLGIAVAANILVGEPLRFSILPYLKIIVTMVIPVAIGLSLTIHTLYLIFIKRSKKPLSDTILYYKSVLSEPRRYTKFAIVFPAISVGFTAFSKCKDIIGTINPYSWDKPFMELDRFLHFGVDPWRALDPLFGGALATFAINFLYNIWFVLMFVVIATACWTAKDRGWERQFLLSFLLTWMIGGFVFATMFSSMGPAFYDLTGNTPNPYLDQMAKLNDINGTIDIWALSMQDLLREGYLNPGEAGIKGISAMPSMHNATAMLMALVGLKINRKLGIGLLIYAIFIAIGSVHLAWHYAVDAYAGFAIAIIIWIASKYLISFQDQLLRSRQPS